jgi:hypothetical protein
MDDEGRLSEGLQLPESLAESGDPVEGNPYPTEHPAHQVWMDATRQAEMEVSRINSEASSSLTPDNADEWMPMLVVAKFDVWAGRGVQVVWTDHAVREYDGWLVSYANVWIDSVSRFLTSHPPPFSPERVLDTYAGCWPLGFTIGRPRRVVIGFSRKRAPPRWRRSSGPPVTTWSSAVDAQSRDTATTTTSMRMASRGSSASATPRSGPSSGRIGSASNAAPRRNC